MNIGFDLDRVFISSPPFIPYKLVDWLYRGPQHNGPSYRFPNTILEQFIRRLSHHWLLRPKIAANIAFIRQLIDQYPNHHYFLISSRYHFLKEPTEVILQRYGLSNLKMAVHLNSQNLQPHLFKEEMINKYNLDLFIDDDRRTVRYLLNKCPKTTILCYNPGAKIKSNAGFVTIKKLAEVFTYLKND